MYWPIIIGTLKFSKLMSINFLKRLAKKNNLIKDQSISLKAIIFLILITISLGCVLILLGENCCWSSLGLETLNHSFVNRLSYLPSLRRPLCELYFSHVIKLWIRISKDSFASKKSYKGRRLYYKARSPASVGVQKI